MGQGISGHDPTHGVSSGDVNGKITDNQNGGSGKNKFADKKNWPTALEEGKQGKHIMNHPNYQQGKSNLTISMDEAKRLAEQYSGKGKIVGNPEKSNREWVDFGQIIGFYIDEKGNKLPTTKGIIHHSDRGVHIVPSHPEGEY